MEGIWSPPTPRAKGRPLRRVTGSGLLCEKVVGRMKASMGQGLRQLSQESIKVIATACSQEEAPFGTHQIPGRCVCVCVRVHMCVCMYGVCALWGCEGQTERSKCKRVGLTVGRKVRGHVGVVSPPSRRPRAMGYEVPLRPRPSCPPIHPLPQAPCSSAHLQYWYFVKRGVSCNLHTVQRTLTFAEVLPT